MIVGEGGAAAVSSRTGLSSRSAAGSLTSMIKTVGEPQKWVASPALNKRQMSGGSTFGMQPPAHRHCNRIQVGPTMVIHHAFGPARRARRVVDRAHFVLVLEPRVDRVVRAGGQELLEGGGDAYPGDAGGRVRKQGLQLGREENHARARVVEYVAHLFGAQPRVDRDDDPTRLQHAKMAEQKRLRVESQKGNPVVFLEAGIPQRMR